MEQENLVEESNQLWNVFAEQEEAIFWGNYEILLKQAKNDQQYRLQAIIDKENEMTLQAVPVVDISKAAFLSNILASKPVARQFLRHNALAMSVMAGIIAFGLFMYSKYNQTDESKRKEEWLYALLNKRERRSFDYLMDKEKRLEGFSSRSKKLNFLFYKFNLVDWSKDPINLNDTTRKIYQLFDPGYKEVHYTEYKPGRFRKVVKVLDKYFIQYSKDDLEQIDPKEYKIYRASLSLRYKGELVLTDNSFYYRYRKNVLRNGYYFRREDYKPTEERFEKIVPYLYSYNEVGEKVTIKNSALINVFLKTNLLPDYSFRSGSYEPYKDETDIIYDIEIQDR